MSSNDSANDVPASARLTQVGDQILAEQARQKLVDDSLGSHLKLNLPDPNPFENPQIQPDFGGHSFERAGSNTLSWPDKFQIGPQQDSAQQAQQNRDDLADRIYPGLGRLESRDGPTTWRLDYGDPGRCKTKASVGFCFTMHWQ